MTDEEQLKQIIHSGELAIIPSGFRCHTKLQLEKHFGIDQISLPFDSGFFSPHAMASIIREQRVWITNDSHRVCIKDETPNEGIRFQSSTYEEINSLVNDKDQPDINRYLDSTLGYYTLDTEHKYVLAHYNWHRFADASEGRGCHIPIKNIAKMNDILNKRIRRLFKRCHAAKRVLFVFGEYQSFKNMSIDDEIYSLADLTEFSDAVAKTFGGKCSVVRMSEINNIKKMVDRSRLIL